MSKCGLGNTDPATRVHLDGGLAGKGSPGENVVGGSYEWRLGRTVHPQVWVQRGAALGGVDTASEQS